LNKAQVRYRKKPTGNQEKASHRQQSNGSECLSQELEKAESTLRPVDPKIEISSNVFPIDVQLLTVPDILYSSISIFVGVEFPCESQSRDLFGSRNKYNCFPPPLNHGDGLRLLLA
jgi:hypothetical protein